MFGEGMKKTLLFKLATFFVLFTFSFYSIGYTVPENKVTAPEVQEITDKLTVEDIGVALDYGIVKEKFEGKTDKIIIHIQDAHCNYEAQHNINKMLDQLHTECGVDVISVEGAEGLVDTSWFRAFPDAEIRKEVADYFMKKGEITGTEFYSITSNYNGTIFGAETRDYYIKNLKAFTKVYPHKNNIENYFTDLKTVVSRLKSIIYPPKLKELDQRITAFGEKELELSAFADYLYKNASKKGVKLEDLANLKKLIETLEYEQKIDFDIVDQERSRYIDALSDKLTKEEMTALVGESIRFKKGHIKAVEFYTYLRELAKTHNLPIVQEYPNLFYYYLYTKLYDMIDNEGLFHEIEIAKTRIKDKLFTDEAQRTLDKYAHMIDLYLDLVNIELTNGDYDTFKKYQDEFTLDDVAAFIGDLCNKYALNYSLNGIPLQVSENLPDMVSFYEIAMKRDNVLIENTLKEMEKSGENACVMIAGGFHTRGMKDILEKKGISYVVITPKITKDVETPYIKVLTNQRTSIEDIITESAAIAGMSDVKKSSEEVAKPESGMMNPLMRAVYLTPLFLEHPDQLKEIDEELKDVYEKMQQAGEEVIPYEKIAKDFHDGVVIKLVEEWLKEVEKNADPGVWQKASDEWKDILKAYIRKCEISAEWTGHELSEATKNVIRVVFKNRFSPGNEAASVLVRVEALTDKQHKNINVVLGGMLSQGLGRDLGYDDDVQEIDVNVKNHTVKDISIKLYSIPGLLKIYEKFNEAVENDEDKIPLDLIAHPGRFPGHTSLTPNMYMDAEDFEILTEDEIQRLALHEIYHIVYGMTEKEVREKVNIMDIRRKIGEKRKKEAEERTKLDEERLIAENSGLRTNLQNIDNTHKAIKANDNVKIVAVVSMERDQKDWQERFDQTAKSLFNSDNSTLMLALKEQIETKTKKGKIEKKTREGNFLGTLLAYDYIKKAAKKAKINYRDYVTLIGMLFGQGERMSPFTDVEAVRKPAIASTAASMDIDGSKESISAIEEALLYFGPVAKYLEARGFRGILDKWGDETQVASVDLFAAPEEGESLAERDVMKVVSVMELDEISDEKAKQKDWVIFDEQGNMLAQVARNPNGAEALREDLKAKMQELGIDSDRVGISLGPVAVSYDVLDIASEVFDKEIKKDGVYFDFDPYFLMALAMDNDTDKWGKAVEADGKLEELVKMVPWFFEKVQRVKEIFKEKYGRELSLKIFDLGDNVYWPDIGQHEAMREKYLAINDDGPDGIVARKIEGISGVRDANGNIIINSEISEDVKVRNSVIINSKITGAGKVNGSVIKDSTLGDVEITDSFAVSSSRTGKTVLNQHSGIYKSLGSKLDDLALDEKMRHGTVLTDNGPVGMMVSEDTNLRDKNNTYNVPIYNNELSFKETHEVMAGVSMEELERRRQEALGEIARIDEKMEKFKTLTFGTSGLRDEVVNMTDMECYINTRGYIEYLINSEDIKRGDTISIAGDRRSSTGRILKAVAKAIEEAGCAVDYCGELPTPAITYWGMQNGRASIMVTGSHIPDDRNGIKFVKPNGEVLKDDEAGILANVKNIRKKIYAKDWDELQFSGDGIFKMAPAEFKSVNEKAREAYIQRYIDSFPADFLKGKRIVLYQHSAVGRDILEKILAALGAEIIPVERSDDKFIPVDTEKLSDETRDLLKQFAEEYSPDVIISTDGDSDRPLFADENGNFLPGDKLGALAAQFLKPDFIAIATSANPEMVKDLKNMKSAKGKKIKVKRTKIGSPYVIKAMNDYRVPLSDKDKKKAKVISWESNGGFLTATNFKIPGGNKELLPIPSRDAALPLLLAIGQIAEGQKASELIASRLASYQTDASKVSGDKKDKSGNIIEKGEIPEYTPDVGKAIVAMFSPKDKKSKIGEVKFDDEKGVTAIDKDEAEYKLTDDELDELLEIRKNIKGYFTSEMGFEDEIVMLNLIDGIRMTFANDDVVHLRPSGNEPIFRFYVGAKTSDRCTEMLAKRVAIVQKMVDKALKKDAPPQTQSPGVWAARTIDENTPEGLIATALKEGKPVYSEPYREAKEWGREDQIVSVKIGEYWDGFMAPKTALLKIEDEAAPMFGVIAQVPKEALGEKPVMDYGAEMPLVKLLTPQEWLSVQFHETKNESWLVTEAEEGARIIFGFSEEAIEEHEGQKIGVSEAYQNIANAYDSKLKDLYEVLVHLGYEKQLEKVGRVLPVARMARASSPKNEHLGVHIKTIEVLRNEMEKFYNYVEVKPGDVIPVKAGMLHALGPGVTVVEPQIPGTTQSTDDFDRLRYRSWYPEAKKGLDLDRIHESIPVVGKITSMEVIEATDTYKIERMPGNFESKGLEAHVITFTGSGVIEVSDIASLHRFWLIEGGEASVAGVDGTAYHIPRAVPGKGMLFVPASAGGYKIIAEAGTKIVDVFTPQLEEREFPKPMAKGPEVPAVDEFEWLEKIVFLKNGDTFDRLDIIKPVGRPEILAARAHSLIVQKGKIKVETPEGTPIEPVAIGKYNIPQDQDYIIKPETGTERAVVKVMYEKTRDENIVYTSYENLRKHVSVTAGKTINLIQPVEMFAPGDDSNDVGSHKWEQQQLRENVNPNITIRTYQAKLGLDKVAEMDLKDDEINVLVGTKANIQDAVNSTNPEVREMLEEGNIRILVIPDIDQEKDLEGKGWYFTREVEGTAILLAAVTPEDISKKDEGNAADDLQKFIEQLTGRSMKREALYFMLPRKEISSGAMKILPEELKAQAFGHLLFLIRNVMLNMPIRPFKEDRLHTRRQLLLSA